VIHNVKVVIIIEMIITITSNWKGTVYRTTWHWQNF